MPHWRKVSLCQFLRRVFVFHLTLSAHNRKPCRCDDSSDSCHSTTTSKTHRHSLRDILQRIGTNAVSSFEGNLLRLQASTFVDMATRENFVQRTLHSLQPDYHICKSLLFRHILLISLNSYVFIHSLPMPLSASIVCTTNVTTGFKLEKHRRHHGISILAAVGSFNMYSYVLWKSNSR